MLFLLYLIVRFLTRPLVARRGDASSRDLEILVLRHQLRVLRRRTGPPKFTPLDRLVLVAASRSLHRSAWASFVVSPGTLLRWHRELVRRKWTYRHARPFGRPPIDPEVQVLILRMASPRPNKPAFVGDPRPESRRHRSRCSRHAGRRGDQRLGGPHVLTGRSAGGAPAGSDRARPWQDRGDVPLSL